MTVSQKICKLLATWVALAMGVAAVYMLLHGYYVLCSTYVFVAVWLFTLDTL